MSISEKYSIIERLGGQHKRKFGETLLALDKNDNSKVVIKAVKIIRENKIACERLRHESKFNFNAKGLPRILDFYESDSEIILVKKYVEGITIDQFFSSIKRRKKLESLIEIMEQLLPIFNELSKLGIIHADIKPGNLIINQENGTSVNLIDFGLAIDKSKTEDRKTLFPLGYAAPELVLNQLELVDQRTDIFALGNLIWKLYTGKMPLTHPNPSIFTNLQLTHPLPEHTDIPNKLFRVLSKMTGKHQFKIPPNKLSASELTTQLKEGMNLRYSSLEEVIDELKSIKDSKKWFTR